MSRVIGEVCLMMMSAGFDCALDATTNPKLNAEFEAQLLRNANKKDRPVNTTCKIGLAMLIGIGFGVATNHGLRAQAKPPTYVVIAIQKITDTDAYKPLPVKGQAAAEAAGGRYLIRTGSITSLDGNAPVRLALIKFDSVEKAHAWYNSAAQKEVDVIRARSTDSVAFIVEGVAE